MLTELQKKIIQLADNEKQLTKKQVVEQLGGRYYCNSEKHIGDVLARMVKSGLLKRLKQGVFEVAEKVPSKQKGEPKIENQTELFQ